MGAGFALPRDAGRRPALHAVPALLHNRRATVPVRRSPPGPRRPEGRIGHSAGECDFMGSCGNASLSAQGPYEAQETSALAGVRVPEGRREPTAMHARDRAARLGAA